MTASPAARVASLLSTLLLAAVLTALAGCSPATGPAVQPDPGIAADLTVVQARTDTLFQELDRNAAMSFSDYDAMHYGPLLEMVGEAQHLARVHDRSDAEQSLLNQLAQTYQDMRTQHRQGKLSYESLKALHTRIYGDLDKLMKMEQQ